MIAVMRHLIAWLATLGIGLTGLAQTQSLSFEVATLKINKSGAGNVAFGCYDPRTTLALAPPGRCVARNALMRTLIGHAYNIPVASMSQTIIAPGWIASERYDLEAKAEDAAASDADLRRMLQTLLAERVKLQAHFELRDIEGFVLVTAKGGTKLQKTTSKERASMIGNVVPPSLYKTTGKGATMEQLTSSLSLRLGRMVVDKTGLDGGYDFVLTWARDDIDPTGPSLFTALQEQLGLKLESQKVPARVLVVDHIERPSEIGSFEAASIKYHVEAVGIRMTTGMSRSVIF